MRATQSDSLLHRNETAGERVASGVYRIRTLIANLFIVETDEPGGWVLVDAGVAGFAKRIRRWARRTVGDRPPSAIVLTHGHFDHRGSLNELLRSWDVPVYAHPLEFPYLTGRRAYPPPDPSVGGGMMARLSFLYPRRPIEVGPRLLALPSDGRIRELAGWRWCHTPGHTPGHVALFRDDDRVLLAGDAVTTTRQESAAAVVMERPELRPPPAYFTIDWPTAEASVRSLAALEPNVLATGHGRVMRGESMREALHDLARQFRSTMPRAGWYVSHPVHHEDRFDDRTVAPELAQQNRRRTATLAVAGAAFAAAALAILGRRRTRPSYARPARRWRPPTAGLQM